MSFLCYWILVNNGFTLCWINGIRVQAQDDWVTGYITFPISFSNYAMALVYSNCPVHTMLQDFSRSGTRLHCWERTAGGWSCTDWADMIVIGF